MSTVDVLVKIARAQQRGTLPSDMGISCPSRCKQVILTPSGGHSGTIQPLLAAQAVIGTWLDRNFARHDAKLRNWRTQRQIEEIRYSERGRKVITRGWYEHQHLRWIDGQETMIEMDILIPHVHHLPLTAYTSRNRNGAIFTTWRCKVCDQKLTKDDLAVLGVGTTI